MAYQKTGADVALTNLSHKHAGLTTEQATQIAFYKLQAYMRLDKKDKAQALIKEIRTFNTASPFKSLTLVYQLFSDAAYAGGGGAEFDDVWATLREWTEGTLGRIVAGAMILVGIIGGIARQSLMAFALGVAGGMGLYNTPTIIETIMSATLEKAATVTPAVMQLTNGLGG